MGWRWSGGEGQRSGKQLKAAGHDWEEAWADAEMLSSQVVSSLIKSAHPQSRLRVARTHTHTHTHSDMVCGQGAKQAAAARCEWGQAWKCRSLQPDIQLTLSLSLSFYLSLSPSLLYPPHILSHLTPQHFAHKFYFLPCKVSSKWSSMLGWQCGIGIGDHQLLLLRLHVCRLIRLHSKFTVNSTQMLYNTFNAIYLNWFVQHINYILYIFSSGSDSFHKWEEHLIISIKQ